MLLSSVILVLQETLEAALLVSVLLAISYQLSNRRAWLLLGVFGGALFSFMYARYMGSISEWFDYVGQEIVNAVLQIMTTFMIVACTWALFKSRQFDARGEQLKKIHCASIFLLLCSSGSDTGHYKRGFRNTALHERFPATTGLLPDGISWQFHRIQYWAECWYFALLWLIEPARQLAVRCSRYPHGVICRQYVFTGSFAAYTG